MSPEEENALLLSLLTQRPDEQAQETSPIEADRMRTAKQAIDIPWTHGGEPPFRVPDFADEMGTQQQASDYQTKLAETQEAARKQAEYEQALDEVLNRTNDKTRVPYGGTYVPPWPAPARRR